VDVILQQGSLLNAETSGPVWIPWYTAHPLLELFSDTTIQTNNDEQY
jgi:hypothetical protein